jgi:proteasome component ECM29
LETLSGYESSELNYLSLKLNSADLQEKLDAARVSSSKGTPMLEIIFMNMQFIDEKIIEALVPKLIEIVKKGLGVSTKAGLCQFVSALITDFPNVMTPYAGKLMAVLVNAISTEPNKTIRKCYCNTLGSLVKISKESSIENLLNRLQQWYFEREG